MAKVNTQPTLFPSVRGEQLMDNVYRIILISAIQESPRLRDRAIKAYTAKYGKYTPAVTLEDPAPLLVMGPPGQGKTACITKAAKAAAQDMGLNFVTSTELSMEKRAPGKDDFVLAVHSLGGEISTISLTGLPTRIEKEGEDGDIMEYTGNISNKMYAEVNKALQMGGYGIVFFDDVTNAVQHVLTALYNVVEEREINGNPLPPCVLAGNLGREDGNTATDIPAALMNRTKVVYYSIVGDENKILDILNEKKNRFASLGCNPRTLRMLDAYMGFLRTNPSTISTPAKSGRVNAPQPTPRSIEKSMDCVVLQGMDGGEDADFVQGVTSACASLCGKEFTGSMIEFFNKYSTIVSRLPLAPQKESIKPSDKQDLDRHVSTFIKETMKGEDRHIIPYAYVRAFRDNDLQRSVNMELYKEDKSLMNKALVHFMHSSGIGKEEALRISGLPDSKGIDRLMYEYGLNMEVDNSGEDLADFHDMG